MSGDDPQPSSPESAHRPSWLRVWGPTVVWLLVILTATSVPGKAGAAGNGVDKFGHLVAYGVLGALLRRFWQLTGRLSGSRLWPAALLIMGSIWALLDELHQIPIAGREFELSDVAADVIGLLAGFWLAAYWQYRQRSQSTHQT